jgi:predicted enzyme related to lactoylglutathione lyase
VCLAAWSDGALVATTRQMAGGRRTPPGAALRVVPSARRTRWPWQLPDGAPVYDGTMRLTHATLPVRDIDAAAAFYAIVLGTSGERIPAGRHAFDCDGTVLICSDARVAGEPVVPGPHAGPIYLSTREPLAAVQDRTLSAGATLRGSMVASTTVRTWAHGFYATDPWGNPFCISAAGTEDRARMASLDLDEMARQEAEGRWDDEGGHAVAPADPSAHVPS